MEQKSIQLRHQNVTIIKMKNTISMFIILFTLNCSSQQFKDTVYIYFDSTHVGMKKVNFKVFKSKKYPNEKIKNSYTYKIEEKKMMDTIGYDKGYTFTHFNQGRAEYEVFGGRSPLALKKEISFLKTIKPLTIDFFLNTDYKKVCKTFEEEDSHDQNVIIFMIDKDEINDGKLILREVTFSRPLKI